MSWLKGLFGEDGDVGVGADEDAGHVGRLVPFGFARHIVIDGFSVYDKILEPDIGHLPIRRIAANHRQFRVGSVLRTKLLHPPLCPRRVT